MAAALVSPAQYMVASFGCSAQAFFKSVPHSSAINLRIYAQLHAFDEALIDIIEPISLKPFTEALELFDSQVIAPLQPGK